MLFRSPNFVHSLDATHMMLTAINCAQQGLTFASVHDSYWTHAADVEKMNRTIRETFIALHESNVLKKLDEEVTYSLNEFTDHLVVFTDPRPPSPSFFVCDNL